MLIETVNPFNGKVIKTYERTTISETKVIISKLHESYLSWKNVSFNERSLFLQKISDILREEKEECAQLMAIEMGKPISQGRAEIDKCARACEYFAKNGQRFLQPEIIETNAKKSFVSFQPIGIILAIMPWNFPFWQVFRCAAPSLMAGNTILLKHAQNVSGCSIKIESIFKRASTHENIFRNIIIGHESIPNIINDPLISAVSLTGGTQSGRAVAGVAGNALKKCILELGGNDPYIILEDADIESAAKICADARIQNSGQSCIAAKRFIVVEKIKKQFIDSFVGHMSNFKVGDPLDPSTEIGPLARFDLRNELHKQVTETLSMGATKLLGGIIPQSTGAFYPPTVLTNISPSSPAATEELFGPVASIFAAKDSIEAISIANRSKYGLGSAIFTSDIKRAEHIAEHELDAGICFINSNVFSDPRLPFGGVKESGYGRELSQYGIKEFVNVKTILLK